MTDRNKRVFISDIHMGDANSSQPPNPYGWFKNNILKLADFLADQKKASDVKEVIILGDLFDDWVIPTEDTPLADYTTICKNADNAPVIAGLKALADSSCPVKLTYVPGNHDMGMNIEKISEIKNFLTNTFPGMHYLCNNDEPWGVYNLGILAAEHGDRYCLFNAPDKWTAPLGTFLPIGYFITRMVAHKVKAKGQPEDYHDILVRALKELFEKPKLVEAIFDAIAGDADLNGNDIINTSGIPDYPAQITVNEIKVRFSNLIQSWTNYPGNIHSMLAIIDEMGNLSYPAHRFYLDHYVNIVIFGHTHVPVLEKNYFDVQTPGGQVYHSNDDPCTGGIYVNSGSWVDSCKDGCTYVETEERPDKGCHYVRLKKYPGNAVIDEGFVKI
jgi:UDP-2,3-diacylglucosamine pyrophosphatase LpxH